MKKNIISNDVIVMKQTYIVPLTVFYQAESESIIAESIPVGGKDSEGNEITVGGDESLGRSQSSSSKSIWDDEW